MNRTFALEDTEKIKPQIISWPGFLYEQPIELEENDDQDIDQKSMQSAVDLDITQVEQPSVIPIDDQQSIQPMSVLYNKSGFYKKKPVSNSGEKKVQENTPTEQYPEQLTALIEPDIVEDKKKSTISMKPGSDKKTFRDQDVDKILMKPELPVSTKVNKEQKPPLERIESLDWEPANRKSVEKELQRDRTHISIDPIFEIRKQYIKQNANDSQSLLPRQPEMHFKPESAKPLPRLVIGKLTVEVIQKPRERDKQIQLPKRENTYPSKSQQHQSKNNSVLKVQFGMGQI